MKLFLILVICFGLFPALDSQIGPIPKVFKYKSFRMFRESFPYHDLQLFRLDSLEQLQDSTFKRFDSTTHNKLLIEFDFYPQMPHRPFSWQERDSTLAEFTVLFYEEDNYILQYNILDSLGHHKDHFIAAAIRFEENSYSNTYGRFADKSTYVCHSVHRKWIPLDSIGNFRVAVDSTVTHFLINKEGKVKEKEISKTSFDEKNRF